MGSKSRLGCLVFTAVILLVSACSPSSPAVLVFDADAIRTEAVATAIMDITVQAILHPVSSPLPPASEMQPTAEFFGTPEAALGTAEPIVTTSPAIVVSSKPLQMYACECIGKKPPDSSQTAGAVYDMVWTIRNIGSAIWKEGEYDIKWLGGSDLSAEHTHPLSKNVAPFEVLEVSVSIRLPSDPSDEVQVTRWGIVNDSGEVFCKFFHAVPSTHPPSP